MGINSSKSASVIAKTPEKKLATETIEESPTSPANKSSETHQFLDPKTPAVPQTPLTQTIANHLNKISKDDVNQNLSIKTPSYLLRKRILYDLGYTYSIKDTDPRSPSHSIPRTPLNLAEITETVTESEVNSFQYNSTLEDSCRDFNAKLDDITMEEADIDQQNESAENLDKKNENTADCQQDLCGQKTPNADEFRCQTETDSDEMANGQKQEDTIDSSEETADDKITSLDSMYSTPITKKSSRAGRIPLSQLNRRGMSTDLTPINHSMDPLSVEKYRKDLSFNSFDENRCSARKSKIPVFKK